MSRAITKQQLVGAMAVGLKNVHIRYSLLWAVGVNTGFRISDLLKLKTSHLMTSCITLKEGKTKNLRSIKLKPEIYDFFIGYAYLYRLKPNDFLFFSSKKGVAIKSKSMSRQWVNRIIGRIARLNGLEMVSSHSMRKTYACKFFSLYGDVNALKNDLGHKHLSTTLIYLKDLLEFSVHQ
jgi:integrase